MYDVLLLQCQNTCKPDLLRKFRPFLRTHEISIDALVLSNSDRQFRFLFVYLGFVCPSSVPKNVLLRAASVLHSEHAVSLLRNVTERRAHYQRVDWLILFSDIFSSSLSLLTVLMKNRCAVERCFGDSCGISHFVLEWHYGRG